MPSWKIAQSKRQSIKRTKLALIILALVALLLILAQVVKFTQALFRPWNTNVSMQRSYLWNGDFNINVLLHLKSVYLLSYNPKGQKITTIEIPDKTYLEVSHSFGMWQLRSVYGLGGSQLLKDSVTSFLGIPIDGFLDFSGKFSDKREVELIDIIRKNPLSSLSILPFLKTDITLFEWIRLHMGLSSVRFDKIKYIDLEDLGLLENYKLADGTEVLTGDPQRLDSLSPEIFDPLIQEDHKTVAIFNSTDHPNLAQKAARLINNIGGDVIIVTNGAKKYKQTIVLGEKSKTLTRLRQIFNGNGKIDAQDEDLASSRAQINVFLGEDFFQKL